MHKWNSALRRENETFCFIVWEGEVKPDYELTRNIPGHLEDDTDRQERRTISGDTFPNDLAQCESFDIVAFYFDLKYLSISHYQANMLGN